MAQGDRWEEGHDPELFNLRRRTSKDDAVGCLPLPSIRSVPESRSPLPKEELPPHLLNQGPSDKVRGTHTLPHCPSHHTHLRGGAVRNICHFQSAIQFFILARQVPDACLCGIFLAWQQRIVRVEDGLVKGLI